MTTQREVHLIERPEGLPSEDHFSIVETEVGDPAEGEILIKNTWMSVDPAMRPRLSNNQQPLNAPMWAGAIGEVVASRHPDFKEGDSVQHQQGFRELLLSDGEGINVLDPGELPATLYLHVLGGTGLTAYGGLLVTGELKDGEKVFVSAAAGAVGSVAVQIARIRDCYTIGSTGSNTKCDWLKNELGLDAVINYREGSLRKNLKEAAPDGIDVYFDNVGGEHLDAALPRMNPLGRIPICGMISAYNTPGARSAGVTTLSNMIYNRITMKGFVVYEFNEMREQFLSDMIGWIKDGRMQYRETILDGIDNAPKALIGLFTGENIGKMLVKLA
ncbi:MAG: NADP-dependent oxidoreductase [Pseudomonadales bacterium]